ncbi:MAG: exosortase VPDSG-CTERM-specific [Verrucomicrobia bacterium]|nr:exosortase VPDSG-CTERM-specific [Verrucomicrobiota bacterium]
MSVSTPTRAPVAKNIPYLPKGLIVVVLALVVIFGWPLFELARFSIGHDLYSHIVLIPLISIYLVWQQRASFPTTDTSEPNRRLAYLLVGAGIFLTILYLSVSLTRHPAKENALALTTLAFLLFFVGTCAWFLGRVTLRFLAFPLGFLAFMIPFPLFLTNGIETFLQHGSAWVARGLFKITGTTVFAEDLIFQLPGISLQVAPECSGIHSSLALLITSVLAGYFFLRSPRNRLILALAVIPLALIRNGFRVFVIGELCVHISPDMINSYIHRRGGPIFFVLSLIPFFFLLVYLIRSERRQARQIAFETTDKSRDLGLRPTA